MKFKHIPRRRSAAIVAGLLLMLLPAQSSGETLEEALISAYQNYPGLQAERARLRELDETYVQAGAQGRLTSDLSGTVSVDMSRTPSFSVPIPGFDDVITSGTTWSSPAALQLRFIQPIYQGGRVWAQKSQAMAGISAAREGLRANETDVFLKVANAYVDVLRDEEAARIRRKNVLVLMRQKEAADSRFEVGAGTRTDLAQADVRLAGAKVGLAQADAQLQISRAVYKQMTGHMPENLQPLPRFVLPESEAEAAQLAKNNNPGVLAARYQEDAGDAAISVAKSAKKPIVALTGNVGGVRGQAGFPERAESASIGAQITVPIFSGGMNASRLRTAENARTRLMFETRDRERQIEAAVMQAWAGLVAARAAMEAGQVEVSAAELALEGVELEREVGTRNALDVLNAEQELLEARLKVLNSRSEVEKAGYRILTLTGGFDAVSLSLATEYYDPDKNLQEIQDGGFPGFVDDVLPEEWR